MTKLLLINSSKTILFTIFSGIVILGSILYLYLSFNQYSNLEDNTIVEIHKKSILIGECRYNETHSTTFQIKNIGRTPLVIQSIKTSCGCTVAKYDKKPISQGETTTVILEYKPNSLGYFTKTADVLCNIPQGFVRLKISGEVVEK